MNNHRHPETRFEADTWAVMGLVSREDGTPVTLADYEVLWEGLMQSCEAHGLRFSGRAVPVDFNALTPEAVAELLDPRHNGVEDLLR
ncbi:hypothetical protein ACMT4L_00255 [Deinococcus sp. A31D244]|uniref:Uncharacterized protein n=1 Tax=Deinococcus aquaticus TaxID=328692 RepID=A0ABY7UYR1_9DEIO|nr:hypothetical protein [Deinococcus aquaticus]WDA57711.1 hypothetical protein M8445_10100 [Deinococcus aquaticus]